MLPKHTFPTYKITLPISKKEVKFRPWVSVESKKMMTTRLTKDTDSILDSIVEVIGSCIFDEIALGYHIPMADLLYLFIQVKMKSKDEIISLNYKATLEEDGVSEIIPIDLSRRGGRITCQQDAFLCAAKGVSIGIEFQKKLGTGLFGGEGFIMEKLEGDGMAFVHAGGHVEERDLQPGEILKVDTGCIVAFTKEVDYDIQFVGGIKNTLFGGEGVFFATLRGPGKVWIQSLPISRLAGRIMAYGGVGGRREEGGILGGLGNILDGDGY